MVRSHGSQSWFAVVVPHLINSNVTMDADARV